MVCEGAQIHELLDQADEKKEEFEVEIQRDNKHLIPGVKLAYNKELPASALTIKNQFKKLNYS
jgi:hypothetical protein